jgi:AcrR family transcriptional regulator
VPKILTDMDIETFRERLCDVAEQMFASHGPDGVTMRQLAAELGVSSMTPYRYFKDKDAILAAVRRRAFTKFATAMEEATKQAGGGQPGGAYLAFALANPSAYRMMFDTYQPTFHEYPDLLEAMERARSTMTAGWKQLGAKGALPEGMDIDLVGHLHWSAMHGAVMLELAGLLRPPLSAAKIAEPTLIAIAKNFGIKLPSGN